MSSFKRTDKDRKIKVLKSQYYFIDFLVTTVNLQQVLHIYIFWSSSIYGMSLTKNFLLYILTNIALEEEIMVETLNLKCLVPRQIVYLISYHQNLHHRSHLHRDHELHFVVSMVLHAQDCPKTAI